MAEIDYDLFIKQVHSLPIDVIEKIRRHTYRPISVEMKNAIIAHSALKYILNEVCERKNVKKDNLTSLLKFLNDKNQIIPFNYSTVVSRMLRHYKYRNYKSCFLIDKIQQMKSFGLLWNILTSQEQVNVIRYVHYNY